jgi:hypothetical protein
MLGEVVSPEPRANRRELRKVGNGPMVERAARRIREGEDVARALSGLTASERAAVERLVNRG